LNQLLDIHISDVRCTHSLVRINRTCFCSHQ